MIIFASNYLFRLVKKLIFCVIGALVALHADAATRWEILPDSNVISMTVADSSKPHADHVEMSGKMMSVVLYWDIDSNSIFNLERSLVFPMLRTIPNNTHASLMLKNNLDLASMLRINGKPATPVCRTVEINGAMNVISDFKDHKIELNRQIFPTTDHPAMIELYTLRNNGDAAATILVPEVSQSYTTDPYAGVQGSYIVRADTEGAGVIKLRQGEEANFALVIQAYPVDGGHKLSLNADDELAARKALIAALDSNLILNTPDDVIDTEFRYAKIRGAESIFKTKGGYMHAPGGESYYAALWCNDQAEYINPFFPFLGYEVGNESALNCFRHFARYINDDYKPIPSSIIAEGDGFWNGAGDRGDAAMLAYGASRYALARADRAEAEEIWPLIEWCLEYCRRNLDENGVVKSDCDELERRFPAGDANLCTSSLYYDALISAAALAREIGNKADVSKTYLRQAQDMRRAIDRHFGANIMGYETYRYYEGNDILRSWICIPLVMGIDDRAQQTAKALFSPEMYTDDGVLTSQGYPVFWDRATLYTLRGVLYSGFADEAMPRLSAFSHRRLLGDHVPYPVEAWPEGSQRHLSAESGLYCRVITEGLFGIRPTGMHSFSLKPSLPADWDFAELRHIRAFGADFDILIRRISADRLLVTVDNHNGRKQQFKIRCGKSVDVRL